MIGNAVKAIIVRDGKLLCLKCEELADPNETYYYRLPGGGVEAFEDMYAAIKRQCLEEIGAEVKIRDLLFIRDYIAKYHELGEGLEDFNQTEHIFLCDLARDAVCGVGTNPNCGQVCVEWIPIKDLHLVNFYPKKLREAIQDFVKGEDVPIYLGDLN